METIDSDVLGTCSDQFWWQKNCKMGILKIWGKAYGQAISKLSETHNISILKSFFKPVIVGQAHLQNYLTSGHLLRSCFRCLYLMQIGRWQPRRRLFSHGTKLWNSLPWESLLSCCCLSPGGKDFLVLPGILLVIPPFILPCALIVFI